MDGIKVLAFDTGGTILDWHTGIVRVLAETGAARGVERDWHGFANEYRRRSLGRILGTVDPDFTIDDVHREVLDEVLGCWTRFSAKAISGNFRQRIAAPSRNAGTNSAPGRISGRRSPACGGAMSVCRSRS